MKRWRWCEMTWNDMNITEYHASYYHIQIFSEADFTRNSGQPRSLLILAVSSTRLRRAARWVENAPVGQGRFLKDGGCLTFSRCGFSNPQSSIFSYGSCMKPTSGDTMGMGNPPKVTSHLFFLWNFYVGRTWTSPLGGWVWLLNLGNKNPGRSILE